MRKNLFPILISYFALYTIWGSTYLAIRWVVETVPPYYVVSFRFFTSGLAFILYAAVSGKLRRLPTRKELGGAAFLAVFLLLGGNGLLSVGEKTVDSYIAAIIISSTPFAVAFFNKMCFKEKISLPRFLGMAIGFAGVLLLLYDGHAARFSLTWGMFFVALGFLSWSFGTALSKAVTLHPDTIVNAGIEWTMAGAVALAISLVFYEPLPEILPHIGARAWGGLVYLATFGAAGMMAYNYLLKHEPTKRIVSYAIVNPLVAVLLGIFLAGEKPVPYLIPGMIVTILGLVLMLYGDSLLGKDGKSRN